MRSPALPQAEARRTGLDGDKSSHHGSRGPHPQRRVQSPMIAMQYRPLAAHIRRCHVLASAAGQHGPISDGRRPISPLPSTRTGMIRRLTEHHDLVGTLVASLAQILREALTNRVPVEIVYVSKRSPTEYDMAATRTGRSRSTETPGLALDPRLARGPDHSLGDWPSRSSPSPARAMR